MPTYSPYVASPYARIQASTHAASVIAYARKTTFRRCAIPKTLYFHFSDCFAISAYVITPYGGKSRGFVGDDNGGKCASLNLAAEELLTRRRVCTVAECSIRRSSPSEEIPIQAPALDRFTQMLHKDIFAAARSAIVLDTFRILS